MLAGLRVASLLWQRSQANSSSFAIAKNLQWIGCPRLHNTPRAFIPHTHGRAKQHLFHKKHYRGNGNRQSGTLLDIVEPQEHFFDSFSQCNISGIDDNGAFKGCLDIRLLFLMAWRTLRHRDCMRSCGRFLFARPTSRTSVAEQRPQPSQSGRFCFQKFLLCNLWAIRTR